MAGDTIEDLLSMVEAKALEIEEASDQLNDALEAIEDRLNQAQGVSITDVPVPGQTWLLGYGKAGSKGPWKLTATQPDPVEQPLLGASRAIRQQAIAAMPELLRRMLAKQEVILTALKETAG